MVEIERNDRCPETKSVTAQICSGRNRTEHGTTHGIVTFVFG